MSKNEFDPRRAERIDLKKRRESNKSHDIKRMLQSHTWDLDDEDIKDHRKSNE